MTGVRFDDIHSYDDLGLILTDFLITPPEAKTYRVSIAGADGDIDLSEALTGGVKFKNRTITLTFGFTGDWMELNGMYSRVMNVLHGKRFGHISLDDDGNHYYIGRVCATALNKDAITGTVKVQCIVDPYKYDWGDDWLWDPFDFDDGFINEVGSLTVEGTLAVMYICGRRSYVPCITASSAMSVEYNGKWYSLASGKNKILDIEFTEGENNLTFSGTGTVSIENKGGIL